jgi:glutaredoxin
MTRPPAIRLAAAVVAAAFATALAAPASAQYRWIDANGKVNFGDQPPKDAKEVKPIGNKPAAGAGDSTSGMPFELRRAVERAPVVLYTTTDCQPCTPAVQLLRQRGIPYRERVVISQADLQEFERLTGSMRLPHITIGSQSQNGFNPEIWTTLLDAAGYPKGSMLPLSYQWPAPQPLLPPAKAEAKPAEGDGTQIAPVAKPR